MAAAAPMGGRLTLRTLTLRALLPAVLLAGLPAAAAAKTYFLIVGGLGGELSYAKRFDEQVKELADICEKTAGDPSLVETLRGADATTEAVEHAFDRLRAGSKANDTVAVFLIGHGSFDGRNYRFNLRGPDLTAIRLKDLLDSLPAQDQLLVNTSSSSGASLERLTSDRRVVITATKSGGERTATVFARYWVEALREPEADINKDEVITALEAFRYAERQVASYYEQAKKLATEHPRLKGDAASGFTLARLGEQIDVASNPALRPLIDKRADLERQIAQLRARKDALEPAEYVDQLQKLLVELARTQAEIDAGAQNNETAKP